MTLVVVHPSLLFIASACLAAALNSDNCHISFVTAFQVSALATDGATVQVITDSQRKYAAWVGGSMLGSLPTIKDILITKDEYDEDKEDVVAKRCFT